MSSLKLSLKEFPLLNLKRINMCFGRETLVKTFTYLYKVRQKPKELFSFSKKTQIAFIEEHVKAKLVGGHKSPLSFHMLILKASIIIRLKRSGCSL